MRRAFAGASCLVRALSANQRTALHFELRDETLQRVLRVAGQRQKAETELIPLGAVRQRERAMRHELQIEREAAQSAERQFAIVETRAHGQRSEERRVGKECRARWSPAHEENTV